MAVSKAEDLTQLFSKLGPRTSLYTPPDHAPGELVILCTWLGAAPKYITKYILAYHKIAPRASILLIQSDVSIITASYPSQRKAIIPACHAIQSIIQDHTTASAPEPKILIHTFSNGGTNSATQVLLALRQARNAPLPIAALLCDSGPARGEYWKSHHSMLLSMPNALANTVGPLICHFILIVLFTSVALGRYEKPETLIRRTLLDGTCVVGSKGGKGRVAYLFSKEDGHVEWEDVVAHADVARRKGWEVEECEFVGTGHCGHFRGGGGRYVAVMRRMWEGIG